MPRSANRRKRAGQVRRAASAVIGTAVSAGLLTTLWKERLRHALPRRSDEPQQTTGGPSMKAVILLAIAATLAGIAGLNYGFPNRLGGTPAPAIAGLAGVDTTQAPELIIRYGCGGCHAVPGVPGARGQVGPSLSGFASRVYIAGALTNSPNNLVRWLVNPRAVDTRTAMPVTGISEEEARIVAAYLLGGR